MRKKLVPAILGLYASMAPVHAAPSPMQPYEIQLPDHVLRVSLPLEVVRGEWPIRHTRTLDPQNPSFVQDDFYEVFEVLYDFNGPFWVGAYGSLKINIIVQKKKPALAGDITTIEGLERYVREWKMSVGRSEPEYVFSIDSINGMPAVRRTQNSVPAPGGDNPFEREIYSVPLTADMFVDVGFTVRGWKDDPTKEPKWKPKAETMRDAIKSTVTLHPKTAR